MFPLFLSALPLYQAEHLIFQKWPIASRFYATRTFQRVTGDLFGVSVFAARTVIHKVSRAIAKQKGQLLSFPENQVKTKRKLYAVAHFPDVIRAIDCTNIRIIYPNKENAMSFVNRYQFVVVMPLLASNIVARIESKTAEDIVDEKVAFDSVAAADASGNAKRQLIISRYFA